VRDVGGAPAVIESDENAGLHATPQGDTQFCLASIISTEATIDVDSSDLAIT
jgi:hypothetical protein